MVTRAHVPIPPATRPRLWSGISGKARSVIPGGRLKAGLADNRLANAGLPKSLGRLGSLEVRLARSAGEVKRAQKLRYRVFYEEMAAVPDTVSLLSGRDRDRFDAICDHLIVVDHAAPPTRRGRPRIIGTYRLLRQEVAARHGGFYVAAEFDIDDLVGRHSGRRFLELGRSCVLPTYRNRRTVELLWHGIWAYVRHHRIDVMFGCASLPATSVEDLAPMLAVLGSMTRAEGEWAVSAVRERYVPLGKAEAGHAGNRSVLAVLPPLLKGYLRLGAMIGDGAVVDLQFGTTDVLVVLPVERIEPRYISYFGPDAQRHAA